MSKLTFYYLPCFHSCVCVYIFSSYYYAAMINSVFHPLFWLPLLLWENQNGLFDSFSLLMCVFFHDSCSYNWQSSLHKHAGIVLLFLMTWNICIHSVFFSIFVVIIQPIDSLNIDWWTILYAYGSEARFILNYLHACIISSIKPQVLNY
jgi:hypothetical protein